MAGFGVSTEVMKADPEIDPKMVVEAPPIDSKIVRMSVCAGRGND